MSLIQPPWFQCLMVLAQLWYTGGYYGSGHLGDRAIFWSRGDIVSFVPPLFEVISCIIYLVYSNNVNNIYLKIQTSWKYQMFIKFWYIYCHLLGNFHTGNSFSRMNRTEKQMRANISLSFYTELWIIQMTSLLFFGEKLRMIHYLMWYIVFIN